MSASLFNSDVTNIRNLMSVPPETESVAGFVEGPGIIKLELKFDIDKLREALTECLSLRGFTENIKVEGFSGLPLTRRPDCKDMTQNDLSGRYWLRVDDRYIEEPREELVNEAAFSEFDPEFSGTYFDEVHKTLMELFTIGRMRVLSKPSYNCNSWHRDPEPRLHIPIITNPGSLFVVNHHVTHLPADGSVYFTDTRAYHTAMNGGESRRVHIVAALVE